MYVCPVRLARTLKLIKIEESLQTGLITVDAYELHRDSYLVLRHLRYLAWTEYASLLVLLGFN